MHLEKNKLKKSKYLNTKAKDQIAPYLFILFIICSEENRGTGRSLSLTCRGEEPGLAAARGSAAASWAAARGARGSAGPVVWWRSAGHADLW